MIKDVFIEMVKIDSESKNEKKFAEYLVKKFKDLGLEVWVDKESMKKTSSNAGNVVVHLPPRNNNLPPVGFSAHMDTVLPGKNINPVVKDDIIKSDGKTILGADDKAGIAAIYCACRQIIEEDIPTRESYFIFTTCEEIGLLGAKSFDYSLVPGLKDLIIFDSHNSFGEAIISAPSHNTFEFTIKGKSAHAGNEPEDGINAIAATSAGISKLKLGRIDEETTCNIGLIQGGKATNIVPDTVKVEGEVRSRNESKLDSLTNEIINIMKETVNSTGAEFHYNLEKEYKAFNIPADSELIKLIQRTGKKIGVDIKLTSTGGGSDTNIHAENGLNAVNMSCGMMKVHTSDEYIHLKDLKKTKDFIYEILSQS
ncbi:MAG: M20/M25/M40 family metallo-hydrolase [Candidatus Muiribacteriota bacterium]